MSDRTIPTTEDVLGYRMGTARRLPSWAEIVSYYEQLAAASDRVEIEVIGETTQGRPYIAVHISSAENLGNRDRLRESLARLWDPRTSGQQALDDVIEAAR
ncbi:MAG: hypothetical protein R3A46_19765 [Thermomicrobiales bacterium]